MIVEEYGNDNRIITSHLRQWVDNDIEFGTWKWVAKNPTSSMEFPIYTWHEAKSSTYHAKESVKWVGMTQGAAAECAEDMKEKYTRSGTLPEWDSLNGRFVDKTVNDLIQAKISVVAARNGLWEVHLEVDETIKRLDTSTFPSMSDYMSRQYEKEV